jgi:MFS family permease
LPTSFSANGNNPGCIAMSTFRALRCRAFALLWTGQTISRLGDALYRIALSWWVLEKTGSGAAMGMVLFFSMLPMVLFLLLGGVLVDRLPRARVMVASDVASGLVVTCVSILAFSGTLEVWHVYIASLLFGMVEAFFYPAYTAMVPEVTPPDLLPSANSLTTLSFRLTGVLGPALGAGLVARGGTPLAFACDGASFILSAGFLLPLARVATLPRPLEGRVSAKSEMAEGVRYVMSSTWLWLTIAVFAVVNVTAFGPIAVSLPFLVEGDLKADVRALGLITSMSSVGSILMAFYLGRWRRLRWRGILGYCSTVVEGIVVLLTGLALSVPWVAALAVVNGAMVTVFGLIWTNLIQEFVPREMMGRVSSIDALGSYVFLPVGYAAAGWLTDAIGPPAVFYLGGSLTIVVALLGLAVPAIRRLD